MSYNYSEMCVCGHTWGKHSGTFCGLCQKTDCFIPVGDLLTEADFWKEFSGD